MEDEDYSSQEDENISDISSTESDNNLNEIDQEEFFYGKQENDIPLPEYDWVLYQSKCYLSSHNDIKLISREWWSHNKPIIQFRIPELQLKQDFCYFEVEFTSTPAVGVGLAPEKYSTMIGWYRESIGFHSDDGAVYDNRGHGTPGSQTNMFESGDIIGTYWNRATGRVQFTRNGELVQNGTFSRKKLLNLYPTIAAMTTTTFKVNLGERKFAWRMLDYFYHDNKLLQFGKKMKYNVKYVDMDIFCVE
jgi:hypothetical protein